MDTFFALIPGDINRQVSLFSNPPIEVHTYMSIDASSRNARDTIRYCLDIYQPSNIISFSYSIFCEEIELSNQQDDDGEGDDVDFEDGIRILTQREGYIGIHTDSDNCVTGIDFNEKIIFYNNNDRSNYFPGTVRLHEMLYDLTIDWFCNVAKTLLYNIQYMRSLPVFYPNRPNDPRLPRIRVDKSFMDEYENIIYRPDIFPIHKPRIKRKFKYDQERNPHYIMPSYASMRKTPHTGSDEEYDPEDSESSEEEDSYRKKYQPGKIKKYRSITGKIRGVRNKILRAPLINRQNSKDDSVNEEPRTPPLEPDEP
jgi:hypothetical protein